MSAWVPPGFDANREEGHHITNGGLVGRNYFSKQFPHFACFTVLPFNLIAVVILTIPHQHSILTSRSFGAYVRQDVDAVQ